MKELTDELPLVATNPQKPNVPSFPFRFGVTTALYLALFLVPMKYGFGLDVVNVAGIIIPTVLFGLIFGRTVTK